MQFFTPNWGSNNNNGTDNDELQYFIFVKTFLFLPEKQTKKRLGISRKRGGCISVLKSKWRP